ncbi:MAG: hypothetical protein HY872_14035 [Chloroflexi bacterium]|nr:hypothetical protein [Chloroflexota bacterium]
MASGKLEAYYWEVYALIFESDDILSLDDPGFSLSDEDVASIEQAIHAVLPFRDRSRLYAEIRLAANGETIEERYAYLYYDSGGQRILQYDNRDHHPEISTHPHHMHKGPIPVAGENDRAWPIDIELVSFETVLQRIRERFS